MKKAGLSLLIAIALLLSLGTLVALGADSNALACTGSGTLTNCQTIGSTPCNVAGTNCAKLSNAACSLPDWLVGMIKNGQTGCSAANSCFNGTTLASKLCDWAKTHGYNVQSVNIGTQKGTSSSPCGNTCPNNTCTQSCNFAAACNSQCGGSCDENQCQNNSACSGSQCDNGSCCDGQCDDNCVCDGSDCDGGCTSCDNQCDNGSCCEGQCDDNCTCEDDDCDGGCASCDSQWSFGFCYGGHCGSNGTCWWDQTTDDDASGNDQDSSDVTPTDGQNGDNSTGSQSGDSNTSTGNQGGDNDTSTGNQSGNNDTPTTPSTDTSVSAFAQEVFRLTNAERVKNGLPEFTQLSLLNKAAAVRGQEQATLYSHTRPDGTQCFTVLDQFGISYRAAGENIAMGYTTPESVVNGWMNSAGHRANILNANFTSLGVGFYQGSDGTMYWAQEFIGE